MQTIQDVMTRNVKSISPEDTVRRAAELMKELDVGAVPVVDGAKLVGMLTDRDITIRSTAAGQDPSKTRAGDVMSTDVRTCFATQTVEEVLAEMGDVQIRRVVVVDQASHSLVGIVSLGDMATKNAASTDQALGEISQPSDSKA
ncbi:CBS domain-containing protein [Massilia sp. TWR1-2-2]|uniref:CBS domain-containing protein n=1 Tax=Massilia sp. TWR1-2-2 TaxID=2804584 RepID=UPI003CED3795